MAILNVIAFLAAVGVMAREYTTGNSQGPDSEEDPLLVPQERP
jgi:hypothetical protein